MLLYQMRILLYSMYYYNQNIFVFHYYLVIYNQALVPEGNVNIYSSYSTVHGIRFFVVGDRKQPLILDGVTLFLKMVVESALSRLLGDKFCSYLHFR